MKYLFFAIRRFVICGFIIFLFNFFAVYYNFIIPINLFSLICLFVLDFPGLLLLVLIRLFLL